MKRNPRLHRLRSACEGIAWLNSWQPPEQCEAKTFATAVAFAGNRDRIFTRDVFQSLAGPPDFVSNKSADQRRRRRSKEHSVRKRTIGDMDRAISPRAIQR